MSALRAAALAASLLSAQEPSPQPAPFKGESCQKCHSAIRDKAPSALAPALEPVDGGRRDVIVVGGGLAGLSAGYSLRDLDILVLDKEDVAGGKMRRERFGPHAYPVAGVYMGEPYGRVAVLFKELKLQPEKITLADHTLIDKEGGIHPYWINGDPATLPYTFAVRARFKKLQEKLRELEHTGSLTIPIEDCDPNVLAEYERWSFLQWVDNAYGKEVAELADLYAKDVFGISAREVSAAAGLMYMASEMTPSYTWEGGLGVPAEALSAALGPKLSTGAFVWKVSQDLDGAVVEWHDGRRDHRARARAVIVAVQSLVARRIVVGLSEPKRQALGKVRYSSYALVPLHLKRVLWKDSFVLWAPGRYFADLTLPLPTAEPIRASTSQVLVAYIPMGESEGRRTLLNAPDEDISSKVLAELDSIFKGGASEVVESRVIRWGHAMPVPYPGYLTTVRPIVARPEGRLFFAGVDTQLPAIDGALYSGLRAADAVRRFLKAAAKN